MIGRREFLKRSGAGGAGLLLARRGVSTLAPTVAAAGEGVFAHGVASGDPTPSSVVLWTRVTPRPDAAPGIAEGLPVDVAYEIASDPNFSRVLRRGTVRTAPARDYTVKVDVRQLPADRELYYRFRHGSSISGMGRTRTTPESHAERGSFRFGLASCSNWEGGHFSAYGHLAERDDLDLVLHVGDYLYEYGAGGYGPGEEIGRIHQPEHEILSLADYRIRHAQYKTDPHLRACHAAHPFVATWDDHEVANDSWREGAENHNDGEGKYIKRRNRAYQAYFEWMPLRLPSASVDPTRIYRRLRFGSLADLHVLDTRQYRDEQAGNQVDSTKDDPARTITGPEQMKWLQQGLSTKGPVWRLIGNQLMISPWEAGSVPINMDAWDGYRADRTSLLTHIESEGIKNVVFLTGDIHTSWANEVPLDASTYPMSPSLAVELIGPSVTSDNFDEIAGTAPRTSSVALEEAIKASNRHMKFVELDSHGYVVVDVTGERLHADWHYVDDKADPDSGQSLGASYEVAAGTSTVEEATGPLSRR
jgi:alkaline phosphatase D